MTKKQFLRFVGFSLVLVMMLVLMCDLFETENTKNYDKNMYTYRNLEDNVVDAVYLGTSGADRYWLAPKAYEEYGISLYNLSIDAFPAWLFTSVLDVALSEQDPELVIIDIRAFYQDNTDFDHIDVRARRYLDSLPFFSIDRFKAAFRTMEYMHRIDKSQPSFDASYIFSFIRYHNKWSDKYSLYNNLGSQEQKYGSFYMSKKRSIKQTPHARVYFDSKNSLELDPICEDAFYELLDYIREKDLNVLFVDTPQFLDPDELGRANTMFKILDEEKLNYVHYYKMDSDEFNVDLDIMTDFYDESHVNYYGAEKYTEVFAQYLVDNYDLPDRRVKSEENENAQNFWEGKYENVKKEIARLEKEKAEKEAKEALKAAEKQLVEAEKQAALDAIIAGEEQKLNNKTK